MTIAIIFGAVVLTQAATILLLCWSAERKTRNEFKPSPPNLAGTLERMR